jgi:hypothetical protein
MAAKNDMITTPTITPTPSPETELGTQLVMAMPNISQGGEPIQFKVSLSQPSQIKLSIYSIAGERIFSEVSQGNSGPNLLSWALVNNTGASVASGLYIYVLEIDGPNGKTQKMGKVVVLR